MTQHNVSKAAIRDYIHKERSELKNIILSKNAPYREEARQRRNFLEEQLRIVNGSSQWREELDPTLVSLVLASISKSPRFSPDQTSSAGAKELSAQPIEQPPYWDKCNEMDFRQLREFIDDSLEKLSEQGFEEDRPSSKEEFLDLWKMLCSKIIRTRHYDFANRVHEYIERAFEPGGVHPRIRRVPWRILPPGELSFDNILRHYKKLQQLNPHIRYERDRLTKAYSLGPEEVVLGSAEFEGYIVLIFAHTRRVLLECPVYGHAIYVIDSDWENLSQLTKQELLAHHDATKIVHRGDWFWRVEQELEIG